MTTSHRVYTNTVARVLGTKCQGYGDHLLHPGLLVNIRCSIMNHANTILSILWISTFHLYPNYLFIYVISITCRMVLWSFSVALKLRKSSWKMPHTRINNFTQLSVNSLCLISNGFLAVSRLVCGDVGCALPRPRLSAIPGIIEITRPRRWRGGFLAP